MVIGKSAEEASGLKRRFIASIMEGGAREGSRPGRCLLASIIEEGAEKVRVLLLQLLKGGWLFAFSRTQWLERRNGVSVTDHSFPMAAHHANRIRSAT